MLEAHSGPPVKCFRERTEALLHVPVFSEAGYLSCSFDDGLCGWIRDKEGDLHWETTPDPSGNWRAGFIYSHSHTQLRESVYFTVSTSKWEKAVFPFTDTRAHANTHRVRQSKLLSFCSTQLQVKMKMTWGEVVCLVCRLALCSTKRCKWEVDYATRQWYLWLTLNGNTTLFFLGFRRGENVMNYVEKTL